MGAYMKYFKIIVLSIIMLSFSIANHGRKKHKNRKHRKAHSVRVVHKHPKVKISLGYNYFWRNWNTDFRPYSNCLLYTSPSPRDGLLSRMPSSA